MRPRPNGTGQPLIRRIVFISILLIAKERGLVTGQLYSWETVEEACPNAFLYGNPVCQNNGTLHIGSRGEGTNSCAYCDCPLGWGGVDCNRCFDVSVCPNKTVYGVVKSATNCSSHSLVPTAEESEQQELGKVFSCTCGGGGDSWSDTLCSFQRDTSVVFTINGTGTDESPAFMTFALYAGTDTVYQESWEGEHTYFYPVVFAGSAENCKVTRGNCLAVDGTDLEEQECVRFDCENTQGSCPPEGYEVCDNFPDCVNENGQAYRVHSCVSSPAIGKSLTIACLDDQFNGTFICYYQQPGEFAPLSITCSVGSCLYEGTDVNAVETFFVEESPLTMREQSAVLIGAALILISFFFLFAVLTDWGSSRRDSESCCFSKSSDESIYRSEASSVVITGVGDVAAGRGALPGGPWGNISTGLAQQPALLEWKDLSYAVEIKQGRVGVGSIGGCPLNRNSCHKPQLSVLSKVSGFAGPREGLSVGVMARASSFSSCLSALAAASDGGLRSSHPASDAKLLPTSAVGGARTSDVEEAAAGPMPSTMTGILGPSGAGKSTLLDVLAGRKRSGDGRCVGHISLLLDARKSRSTINSSDGERDACGGKLRFGPGEIRRLSGYVPQEEVLSGTLTCYEHLMFHARLRMPRRATHVERRARALSVLEELGLSRVADSRVGDAMKRGISGGEKRRLSIAAELMAQPPLLFLDEPTTGLDAAAALRVMTLLKGVASRGTTVMCSLHQPRPRVVDLLDNVMLMSGGRVAYFGTPGEAEAYFSSVGRPFPPGQPHPADAMLTLCCREDGCALPMLFERCGLVENGLFKGPIRGGMYVGSAFGSGNSGGVASVMDMQDRQSLRRDCPQPHYRADMIGTSGVKSNQGVAEFEAGDIGDRYGDSKVSDEDGCKYGWFGLCGRVERGGVGVENSPQTAGFLVQTEALSRRLLLRAVRHPLLLALHFLGSLGMAVCLGTIFEGKMGFTFEGAQSRFGALFFILLYLSLLSLTSLPVWREDRRLFLTETMGGAYGHLGYFTSVALVDVLLIRVLPPLFFAVVAYPLMGLNSFSDGHFTLLWFALIIVLVNVAVALAAMGVGALGLPLDLSNLLGGGMVLLFVLFSRFLLNGDRITSGLRWLINVTPVGFAFESLLANEFNDPLGARPYTIKGDKCSPELPVIKPLGATILKTFEFDPELETMRSNVGWLTLIALIFCVISFVLFYAFTRTSPLKVYKSEKGRRRIPSRPTSASFKSDALTAPTPHGTGEQASALVETPSGSVSIAEQGEQLGRSKSKGRDVSTERLRPILLSWEDVGFSIPLRGGIGGYFGELLVGFISGERGRRRWLPVLDEVSGFAGAPFADPVRNSALRGMVGAPPKASVGRSAAKGTPAREKITARASRGSTTAIMGPSGAGKTSLLNVLAGRHREASKVFRCGGGYKEGVHVKGTVRVDGVEVGPAAVREISGYVGQEDVLPEMMTCFEYLMFHAELRLWKRAGEERGRCSGRADRERRVLEVMRELHLENIRDSRIGGGLAGGVSGGERRRLSIGVEMLTRPGLLFLDEPTTGLDSSTAMTIMQLLSGVASRGTTVVCTLHQPRPQAFELLDGVLLLSRGRVAYFGAPSAVADHFASVGCPLGVEGGGLAAGGVGLGLGLGHADAMLDVVAEAESAEEDMDGGNERGPVIMSRDVLVEKVREAEAKMALKPLNIGEGRPGEGLMCRRMNGSRTPPMYVQLRSLSGRAMLNVTRDPYLAALHLVLLPLVGLLLGGLFGDLRRLNEETAGIQGRLGVLFFLLLFLSLLCLTSLASWVKQMELFRHERNSGAYGALAHLLTSFLADALVCRVVPPWLLAVTARPLLGLRYGSLRGLGGGLVVFNVSLAGVLAACGSRARSGQEALAMGCLVVLFSALLSGYLVSRDDLPAFWGGLAWASPFAHGFEALAVNEFSEYGSVFKLTTEISGYTATSQPLSGDNILSCFGYDKNRFDEDLIILAVITAIGLILAYGLLNRV